MHNAVELRNLSISELIENPMAVKYDISNVAPQKNNSSWEKLDYNLWYSKKP
ncbi:MAG: hypothetical protein IJ958_07800 [Agathobacter sp.]|nr:hypothetical protein [Agathobacter sp.]